MVMLYLKKGLAVILMSIALSLITIGVAWADGQDVGVIAGTSFGQISKTTPLVAVDDDAHDVKKLDNIIYVESSEEQKDRLEIDTIDSPREKLLYSSSSFLDSQASSTDVSVANVESRDNEAIGIVPGSIQGPYNVSPGQEHVMKLELSAPSLVAFAFSRTKGSPSTDKLMFSFRDQAGYVAYEWDVDYNETDVIYGDFILPKGTWDFTVNAATPASNLKFKFIVNPAYEDTFIEREPNNKIALATPIPVDTTIVATAYDPSQEFYSTGMLIPVIDNDMFTFTIEEDSNVQVNLLTMGSILCEIADESGNVRYASGNTPNDDNAKTTIECGSLSAGDYLLAITSLGGKSWGQRYAFTVKSTPLQSSVDPGIEKRTIDISVRGGSGTTNPAPGVYEVACDETLEILLMPDSGYVPASVWIDGVESSVVESLDKWVVPSSKSNQTFEVRYEEQDIVPAPDLPVTNPDDDGDNNVSSTNSFLDMALTDLYIDGVHESRSPEVMLAGTVATPEVVAMFHCGPSNFERLYPADADIGDAAVYHYTAGSILISQIVSFEEDGDARYISTEMVFPSETMAQATFNSVYGDHNGSAFELLSARRVGNATYAQERMIRDDITKAVYERTLRSVWEKPGEVFLSGPNEGSSYVVSFENNDKAGTGLAAVTGIGAFYGTKTAEFKIIEQNTSGSGSGNTSGTQTGTTNRTSSTTPLVQTGASTAGSSTGGKTGLVQTGDAIGYGAALLAVVAAVVAVAMVRRRKAGAAVATATPAISVPAFVPQAPRMPAPSAPLPKKPQLSRTLGSFGAKSSASTGVEPSVALSPKMTCDVICSLDDIFKQDKAKHRAQ